MIQPISCVLRKTSWPFAPVSYSLWISLPFSAWTSKRWFDLASNRLVVSGEPRGRVSRNSGTMGVSEWPMLALAKELAMLRWQWAQVRRPRSRSDWVLSLWQTAHSSPNARPDPEASTRAARMSRRSGKR